MFKLLPATVLLSLFLSAQAVPVADVQRLASRDTVFNDLAVEFGITRDQPQVTAASQPSSRRQTAAGPLRRRQTEDLEKASKEFSETQTKLNRVNQENKVDAERQKATKKITDKSTLGSVAGPLRRRQNEDLEKAAKEFSEKMTKINEANQKNKADAERQKATKKIIDKSTLGSVAGPLRRRQIEDLERAGKESSKTQTKINETNQKNKAATERNKAVKQITDKSTLGSAAGFRRRRQLKRAHRRGFFDFEDPVDEDLADSGRKLEDNLRQNGIEPFSDAEREENSGRTATDQELQDTFDEFNNRFRDDERR